ncbi:MAG TPA: FHA domain-containing protein [Ktedonobacterales bacterium]|nr:FHA domain-containing protein [Ktedonobacterales bacterium]
MAVCSHCGRESRGLDRYCQYCGQPLDQGGYAPDDNVQGPDRVLLVDAASLDGDAGQEQNQTQAASAVAVAMTGPLNRLMVRRASSDGDLREYVLDGRDVAIGRSPSCDIVLEGDQLASRRHALLRPKNGGYVVVDLGSSNGTYVNGYEIREATTLNDGDRIAIGSFEILYATTGLPGPNASMPGQYGAGPPPVVPPGHTEPYLPPSEDAAAPVSAQLPVDQAAEDEAAETAQHSAVSAQSGPLATSAPLSPADSAAEAEPVVEAEAEASPHTDTAIPQVSRAESKTAPLSSAAARELEALRNQLDDIATALTRKADDEAYIAGQLRAMLVDMRDELAALILRHTPENSATPPVDAERMHELVSVARQAAEHPRHLDYLTSLSAHAGDIADALEAAQLPAGVPLDELEALRGRVNEILGQYPPIS